MDALEVLARFRSDPATAALKVVGFVSHVRADRIAAAKQAGIDQVLARSAFVAKLAGILAGPEG